jgi:adenylate kinase
MTGLIVILGPTGAGKTSVATRLARLYGLTYLCSGDLMRDLLDDPTSVGDEIRDSNDRDIPPDTIAERVVLRVLAGVPGSEDVLLDGFPRTMRQAIALREHLARTNRRLIRVIHVDATESTSLDRSHRRHHCPRCGTMCAAEPDTSCPACGVALRRRAGGDGTAEMTRRRRSRFQTDTVPVIDLYDKEGLVVHLDGERPLPEVLTAACAALDLLIRPGRPGAVATSQVRR